MNDQHSRQTIFLAAASFEDRSLVAARKFIDGGNSPERVYLANVVETHLKHEDNLSKFGDMGVSNISEVNRFSSRSLWEWVWSVIGSIQDEIEVVVDATCLPRELLGMILFALSVKRNQIGMASVWYTSAPEGGYATQNLNLDQSNRWLTRGVSSIRTVVGYPGVFFNENQSRLIAFVGHEFERPLEMIVAFEPNSVSIGTDIEASEAVIGASEYSEKVAKKLKDKIEVPHVDSFYFESNSFESTLKFLTEQQPRWERENVTITAMNTKLSFIGAALFALRQRQVRLAYAVPKEYNSMYCEGIGSSFEFDITSQIASAETTLAE